MGGRAGGRRWLSLVLGDEHASCEMNDLQDGDCVEWGDVDRSAAVCLLLIPDGSCIVVLSLSSSSSSWTHSFLQLK
jgi:hypothetical protein